MKNIPIVIDFDKTLSRDDSLIKSLRALSPTKKMYAFFLMVLCGRLSLKRYLFLNNLMVSEVVYNRKILKLAISRNAVIVSGSLDKYLKRLLSKIIPEERIFGTTKINLIGRNKKKFLEDKYGYKNFDYIGDSFSDIHVWKAARKSYTVKRLRLYRLFVPHLKSTNDLI